MRATQSTTNNAVREEEVEKNRRGKSIYTKEKQSPQPHL